MANTVSNREKIAIIADMADSVASALAPIKSTKRPTWHALTVQQRFKNQPPNSINKSRLIASKTFVTASPALQLDEPNGNGPYKSLENKRVPTACGKDLSHSSSWTAFPDLLGRDLSKNLQNKSVNVRVCNGCGMCLCYIQINWDIYKLVNSSRCAYKFSDVRPYWSRSW